MSQQLQLEQIRHRDAEFDTELDEIGEGIQDLRELAMRQGEEVRRQNVMLTNTASRIDDAHEHMTNVNAKMKETLKEVGRSSDKLCVDIMCIVSSCIAVAYCCWGMYFLYMKVSPNIMLALSFARYRPLDAGCIHYSFTALGGRIRWYILQNV